MTEREPEEDEEEEEAGFVDFDDEQPSMQALILHYLATHPQATFIDLEDEIPGFIGDLSLKAPNDRDSVLWSGMSGSAIHAIAKLAKKGRIRLKESACAYENGARRPQSRKLHWMPVVVELNRR